MIERGVGTSVGVSSGASRQGDPREAVHAGVKAAINAFMKTIARESGRHGIRCNVVCSGVTVPNGEDDIGAGSVWAHSGNRFTSEQIEKIAKSLPLRKVGCGSDITHPGDAVPRLRPRSRASDGPGAVRLRWQFDDRLSDRPFPTCQTDRA